MDSIAGSAGFASDTAGLPVDRGPADGFAGADPPDGARQTAGQRSTGGQLVDDIRGPATNGCRIPAIEGSTAVRGVDKRDPDGKPELTPAALGGRAAPVDFFAFARVHHAADRADPLQIPGESGLDLDRGGFAEGSGPGHGPP